MNDWQRNERPLPMTLKKPNRKPTHPGVILLEDVFPALDLWELTRAKAGEYTGIERLAA